MRTRVLLLVSLGVAGVLLVAAQTALAGWAGSRYAQKDCTRVQTAESRNGLHCVAWFEDRTPDMTIVFAFADATCASGLQLVERRGTFVIRYRGWDTYDGPAPLHKFQLVGNEDNFTEEWIDYVDTPRGCG